MKNTESTKPKMSPEQTLVLRYLTARARGKEQYAKAEAAQAELMAKIGAMAIVIMPNGRKFAVKDTFADVKYAKKLVFIDRFALEELK